MARSSGVAAGSPSTPVESLSPSARQRLLTAKFEYFKLKDESNGVAGGLRCKTVPHITLKSIAQNSNLDPIFAKHETIFEAKLATANAALKQVSDRLRNNLRSKLALKQKQEGKKSITDADRRRWELPAKGNRLAALGGSV